MKDFTNILVAVLIVALVPRPGVAAVPKCSTDIEEFCINCATKAYCQGVGTGYTPTGIPCAAGEACKVNNGEVECLPVVAVPECACGGGLRGCDAYDTDLQIYCIPSDDGGNIFVGTNCSTIPNFSCLEGQCAEQILKPVDCAQSETGLYPVGPECTHAVFCYNKEEQYATETCNPGQYFNTATTKCETFPLNPCTGCTKTYCPIISDCTKYVKCSNGEVQGDYESCSLDGFFDPDSENCGETAVGICVDYASCEFESTDIDGPGISSTNSATTSDSVTSIAATTTTATTTPTKPAQCTAANVNVRYPYENDCQKYYTCHRIDQTSYAYVTSTCPGPYVYNPTSTYCDLASNVPGCVVAT